MMNLAEMNRADYGKLLGAGIADASRGALFGEETMEPDSTNRTILIGLGGMGVRTIDRMKGKIARAAHDGWQKYISFLALDSDWRQLEQALYLESREKLCLQQRGSRQRVYTASSQPSAMRRVLDENSHPIPWGNGQRVLGRAMLHDKEPGLPGVDEQIVDKLRHKAAIDLEPMAHGDVGSYQVYVIGSLCGGTGSGGITEMPALIHEAIPNARVHAVLYLQDVLFNSWHAVNLNIASHMYANTYAALKELNYFMGMSMRPGYSETWSYNSSAFPELVMEGRFFDVPYLISSGQHGIGRHDEEAIEEAAAFLLSRCWKVAPGIDPISHFEWVETDGPRRGIRAYQPGTNGEVEAEGERHEFPRAFASFGYAEAALPEQLLMCYMVGKLCQKAGMKGVSREERQQIIAAKDIPVPFRAADDLMDADEGTAQARDILLPLHRFLQMVHSGAFNFGEDLDEQNITWTKIKMGAYDNPAVAIKTQHCIMQRTSPEVVEKLLDLCKNVYLEYRKNVEAFVREEGPYAFVNLYWGRFCPSKKGLGMGIKQMLKNLIDGKTLEGKEFRGWIPVETARQALTNIRQEISGTETFLGLLTNRHMDQCEKWVQAYNAWGKAQINAVRRDVALGPHGALAELFMRPAEKLTWELEAFGGILENMTDIYLELGSKVDNFSSFAGAGDKTCQVNLAGFGNISYQWVKDRADAAWQNANAQKLRDDLVDDFFGKGEDGMPNSQKWLDVPAARVKGFGNDIRLTSRDLAVPARERFDRLFREVTGMELHADMMGLMDHLCTLGVTAQHTGSLIASHLIVQNQLRFKGDVPAEDRRYILIYPAGLNTTPYGQQVANAIAAEVSNCRPGIQVYFHASGNVDRIILYQLAGNLEIYRLEDLPAWESHYETGGYGLNNPMAFLHGMSPDLTVTRKAGTLDRYSETMPWKDYPAITRPNGDPRIPDPATGRVSREGQLLVELDKTIARAKELGILYSERTPAGWSIKRVCCGKDICWEFDFTKLPLDPMTGLIPLGKELAQAVAAQNSKTLDEISRTVALEYGGVMDQPHMTEELAWAYAARTLRAHVPMYIEVRDTLKQYEVLVKGVFGFNRREKMLQRPAVMAWMLKAEMLCRDRDGTWVYIQPDGKPRNVAVLTDVMKKFLPPEDKKMVENGLLAYYLFTKLSTILTSQQAWDDTLLRARNTLNLFGNPAAGQVLYDMLREEVDEFKNRGVDLFGSEMQFSEMMSALLPEIPKEKWPEIQEFYRNFI